MKKLSHGIIAVVLCFSMVGCSSAWLSVAIKDLPVLIQEALNIASLVTLVTGASTNDAIVINKISGIAAASLNVIQADYDAYKANPTATNLEKIQSAIAAVQANLPAELAAAHISNPALQVKVQTAVTLILTTVSTFAALIPSATAKTAESVPVKPPTPKQLRDQWNSTVCGVDPCKVKLPGAFSQLKSGIGTGLGEAFGHR